MDLQGMSDVDIISLQYSLLEELKQKKTQTAPITVINAPSSSLSIDDVLSNSFKNERRSEKANGRMSPSAKKIIDNSKYSYGDAIEYFAKVLDDGEEVIPPKPYEEFILQRFDDGLGNSENDKEYYCRVSWFNHSCPTYKELSELIGYTHQTIGNYAAKYKWSDIKQQAFDLGYRLGQTPRVNPENFIDNSENKIERNSKEYLRYHDKVLKRDNVCQCCGSKEDLEVHHPMPFSQYNSLGADTNNGIALCKGCHSKYHSEYGYKKNANAVTLALFLRDYGLNPQQSFDNMDLMEKEKSGRAPLPDILKNIKEYEEDHEGYCPISYLVEGFGDFGFNKDAIREEITALINKGVCYSPKAGYVATVD